MLTDGEFYARLNFVDILSNNELKYVYICLHNHFLD